MTKAKEPAGQTTSKFKTETAQASNNGSKQEDWSTAPAENILFPETYLSSIKRVLENTSMQSNSSQPITKNGLGKKVSSNGEKSVKGSVDEEEDAEDNASKVRLEKEHESTKNKTGSIFLQCSSPSICDQILVFICILLIRTECCCLSPSQGRIQLAASALHKAVRIFKKVQKNSS